MNGPDIPDTLPFDKGARLKTIRHLGRLFAQMWHTSPWMMSLSMVLRILVAVRRDRSPRRCRPHRSPARL